MARPPRVLLISCYELGHQPLGVAGPLGALAAAGLGARAEALDLAVEPLDDDRVRAADLVAISVPMHTALRLGARVAARVRALAPQAHLCFYGLYAQLNEAALRAAGAKSVFGAEDAAAGLVALCRALGGEGTGAPRQGPVPVPRHGGQNPAWAPPARAGLPPLDRYARLRIGDQERLAGTVDASRGCLHHCRHCPIPPVYGGRFFVVPVDEVLADVAALVAAGARHITFGDPDFLNGPGHARRVAEGLSRRFPGLSFDFTAKVEHLLRHRQLLGPLARAGALFVVSAVESLSDTVLAHLDKGHTRADVLAALAAVRAAGLALRPTFVPFTPWSTRADFLDLLDWIEAEELWEHIDPVQLSIRLLVPPGSLLAVHPALEPHLGPLAPEAFTHSWTHPDPSMDALARQVARIVAEGAQAGHEARAVLDSVRSAAGAPRVSRRRRPEPVPRLTEPWFC